MLCIMKVFAFLYILKWKKPDCLVSVNKFNVENNAVYIGLHYSMIPITLSQQRLKEKDYLLTCA